MSAVSDSWQPAFNSLERRKHAAGMGHKTGLALSGVKNVMPVLEAMGVEASMVSDGTFGAVEAELAKRIKGPRIGIAKRFWRDLHDELGAMSTSPVSDDEVKRGDEKAAAEWEVVVQARRQKRARTKTDAPARPDGDAAEEKVGAAEEKAGAAEEEDTQDQEDHAQMNSNADEQYDDNDEQPQDVEEQDDAADGEPPAKRAQPRARVQPVQPVFMMQAPPRAKPNRATQPRDTNKPRFVPVQSMVRISKRTTGGKLLYINDYTTDEIGEAGTLKVFLKEAIDPDYAEPSGSTEYIVEELDGSGRVKGQPVRYAIAGQPQGAPSDVDRIRETLDLVDGLRHDAREEAARNAEVLNTAKQSAAKGGDTGTLMMLMMMERLMGPSSGGRGEEAIVKMVLEKLGKSDVAPLPAPVVLPPPAPATSPLLDKMLEMTMMRMMAPAPPPPNAMDDIVKALLLKTLTGEKPQLDADTLKNILNRPHAPAEVSSIEQALGTFEKLSTVVQSLAPKLNMGGVAGALQGLLTPQLQQALGDTLATAVSKGKPAAAPAAPAQPAQPQQPQTPPEIQAKVQALQIAQTPAFEVQGAADLVEEMYRHPNFRPQLEPALMELIQGRPRAAQEFLARLLAGVKPKLANGPFIDEVMRAIAKKAGVDLDQLLKAAEVKPEVKPEEKPPAPTVTTAPSNDAYAQQIAEVERKKSEQDAAEAKKKAEAAELAKAAIDNAVTPQNAPTNGAAPNGATPLTQVVVGGAATERQPVSV